MQCVTHVQIQLIIISLVLGTFKVSPLLTKKKSPPQPNSTTVGSATPPLSVLCYSDTDMKWGENRWKGLWKFLNNLYKLTCVWQLCYLHGICPF